MTDTLPIHAAIPELLSALSKAGRAVLMAPPGAGKTTVVPLEMLAAKAFEGRLIMLEPRRLAARTAAERMAQTLGEPVGQTVGYRIRGEAKVNKTTRIEVVTEGILTRMLQSDPSLDGVGAVIFDEFHERSLVADLGLALTWEAMGALRDDLMLVVMSATLDADPVARLLDHAPIIRSEGRAFPVETRYLDRPLGKTARIPEATADLVLSALPETEGGVLVFLPGEGEIRRCEAALKARLPADCHVHPLFGAMGFSAQRAAIQPAKDGRKIVLATAIAETSLTIQDIRVVVDAGRARRARFDAGSGMSRLITERVSKAEATQRRGRAGRVAPGVCYRLWTRGEEGGLPPFPPAEIETADLAPLALELAMWGSADGSDLAFLTPPNAGVLAEAQALLRDLGALDAAGRITKHGRELARLPMHPRLGHMMISAGQTAAALAALWGDRDPLPRSADLDLTLRLEALRNPKEFAARRGLQPNRATFERIRAETKRLSRMVSHSSDMTDAQIAALAYPDRIGLRRPGDIPRFVLSGGKGCVMDETASLAGSRLIVVTDTDGNPREARIRQAIPISESELREGFADQITWRTHCEWSRREGRVVARRREQLGAVVLDDRIWKDAPADVIAAAMLDGVRDMGLRLSDAAKRFIARVELVRAGGADMPDMREPALLETLEDWLLPHLTGVKTASDWKRFDALNALRARLDWNQLQEVDRAAPPHFTTPLGRKVPIDYSGAHPEIEIRLQELFGVTHHPMAGNTPLRVTLLSPGRKPVQTTLDIPGFWASSYADVRKEMRGRYPKHPWPEDPTQADPTLRAKPRAK